MVDFFLVESEGLWPGASLPPASLAVDKQMMEKLKQSVV